MAIVKTGNMYGQVGRLGQDVYYTAYGETRSRTLAAAVTNPRTVSQMNQRVKWANLVNLYRVLQPMMKYAFETKSKNQSEYNKWMSLNVTNSRIYLTKQFASFGSCVVDNYYITQGSLPSIEFIQNGTSFISNIILDDGTEGPSGMDVNELSLNILRNNPGIREGDQLSLIQLTQMTNPTTGAPYVLMRKYEMLISRTDTRPVEDFFPANVLDSTEATEDCRLQCNFQNTTGGFAMILSRTTGGKTFVSTQKILTYGNSSIIAQYSSLAALNAAIRSYGESVDAFLSTATANYANGAAIYNSIVRVTFGSVSKVPGESFVLPRPLEGIIVVIEGSRPFEETSGIIEIEGIQNGNPFVLNADDLLVDGALATLTTSPAAWGPSAGGQVTKIRLTVGSNIYEASFPIPYEDPIQGLE